MQLDSVSLEARRKMEKAGIRRVSFKDKHVDCFDIILIHKSVFRYYPNYCIIIESQCFL